MAGAMGVRVPRRAVLVGGMALAAVALTRGVPLAARSPITVYKDPT